jgi:hypothetical protein
MPRDLPLGNGNLQISIDSAYRIVDLYYRYVGQHNHGVSHPFRVGVWVDGEFSWTESPEWVRELAYLLATLVIQVRVSHGRLGITLEFHTLAPEIFDHNNIRRVKRRLAHQIQARFRCTTTVVGDRTTLDTRPPTAHERQLVHDTLAMFTYWGCAHVPAPAADTSLWKLTLTGSPADPTGTGSMP